MNLGMNSFHVNNMNLFVLQSLSMSMHQGGLALTKSQEAVAKLPEPNFSVLTSYSISDAPPRPNSYIRLLIIFELEYTCKNKLYNQENKGICLFM